MSRIQQALQRLRLDRKRYEVPHVAPFMNHSMHGGERRRIVLMDRFSHESGVSA